MFRRLWNRVKNNIGTIIGGAIGGPLGAIIGWAVQEFVESLKTPLSPSQQLELEAWIDHFMEPLVSDILTSLSHYNASQLVLPDNIEKFNRGLQKLATLKAYYEFKSSGTASQQEYAILQEKLFVVDKSIIVLIENWKEATRGVESSYTINEVDFIPSNTKSIEDKTLDWFNVSVRGRYTGVFSTAASNPTIGGGTIHIPPPSTTVKPATPINNNPVNNFKPVATVEPTRPASTPTQSTGSGTIAVSQPEAKNNKKYWIIGGAVLLAALLFRK